MITFAETPQPSLPPFLFHVEEPTMMGWLILIVGTVLLTVGFAVWAVLTRDRPEETSLHEAQERLSTRTRREAELNSRRLDADSGRVDRITPDLS